jgi:hypothetical protein
MQVRPVDPRDTRWEINHPAYRVYFWQRPGDPPDSDWASEEWHIEGADVQEVLAWAGKDETHRAYILYVCHTCGTEPGLIRLCGSDPTMGNWPPKNARSSA